MDCPDTFILARSSMHSHKISYKRWISQYKLMKQKLLVSFTRDPPIKYWETILEIPCPQLFMCFRLQLC